MGRTLGQMAVEKTPGQDTALDPQGILTPEELAGRLKTKVSWVYEQTRKRGKLKGDPLPSIRLGKYVRFYWPHVAAWLQTRR